MRETDLTTDANCERMLQASVVNMEKRIRTQMFREANGPFPTPIRFRNVDMLGSDANGVGTVLASSFTFNKIHFWRTDKARNKQVFGRAVQFKW